MAILYFEYDALNRLTEATGPYDTHLYQYDKTGNRTLCIRQDQGLTYTDILTYTYDEGTSRLDSIIGAVATTSYSYDANGNTTGIGNRVLTYNQNNRLIRR